MPSPRALASRAPRTRRLPAPGHAGMCHPRPVCPAPFPRLTPWSPLSPVGQCLPQAAQAGACPLPRAGPAPQAAESWAQQCGARPRGGRRARAVRPRSAGEARRPFVYCLHCLLGGSRLPCLLLLAYPAPSPRAETAARKPGPSRLQLPAGVRKVLPPARPPAQPEQGGAGGPGAPALGSIRSGREQGHRPLPPGRKEEGMSPCRPSARGAPPADEVLHVHT